MPINYIWPSLRKRCMVNVALRHRPLRLAPMSALSREADIHRRHSNVREGPEHSTRRCQLWRQCVSTMKSVSPPVSWLMPWSDMISDEPGVINSEIRSTASCGISMRSRTAFALSGTTGPLRNLGGFPRLREDFSGIDTTVHRIAVPSFLNSTALK